MLTNPDFWISRSSAPPIYLAAALFVAGMAAGGAFQVPPPLARWAALAAGAGWLLLRKRSGLGRLGLGLVILAAGLERGTLSTGPGSLPAGAGAELATLAARVKTVPVLKSRPPYGHGSPSSCRPWTSFQTSGPALEVRVDGDLAFLRPGHRISLTGRLQPPRGARNPGDTANSRSLPSLQVRTPQLVEVIDYQPFSGGLRGLLEGAVLLLQERLHHLLRDLYGDEDRGVVLALLLGDRRLLRKEFTRAFRDSGAFHHLAISGLHASVLLGLFLRLPLPARLRTAVQLVVFGLFAAVTGAAPPVVRAVAMLSFFTLARACRRSSRSLEGFSWTAVALLALWPEWLWDIGFQLSALAVGSILIWSRPLEAALPGGKLSSRLLGWSRKTAGKPALRLAGRALGLLHALLRWGRQSLAVSLAAAAGTAPLILYYFQRLYPLGVFWSIAVAFPVTAILIFGSLSLVLGTLHSLAAAPFVWLTHVSILLLDRLLPALAAVPGTCLAAPAPPLWTVAAAMGILAGKPILGLSKNQGARPWIWFGLLGLLISGSFFGAELEGWKAARRAAPEIWFFDVGAGSSQLLLLPGGASLLIDAGSSDQGAGLGSRLSRALLALGVRRLDGLILTHCDADHTNALEELLDTVPADRLWTSPFFEAFPHGRALAGRLRSRGCAVETLARGDRLAAGPEGSLEVLHPSAREPLASVRSSNDSSLALRLSWRGRSALFTGDLEEKGAARLLSHGDDLRSELMVFPHHGRRHRLIEPLLDAVRPRWIAVSGNGEGGARETASALVKRGLSVHATWRGAAGHALCDPEAGWRIEAPFQNSR